MSFRMLSALALLAVSAAAVEKPNFSGNWTMNADKSDFGQTPKPEKFTRRIDHHGVDIRMTTVQSLMGNQRSTEFALKTDGTETANKMGNAEAKSKARWDGNSLLVSTKVDYNGMAIESKDRWTLSDDGKTFTVESEIHTPQGDGQVKLVLEKQ